MRHGRVVAETHEPVHLARDLVRVRRRDGPGARVEAKVRAVQLDLARAVDLGGEGDLGTAERRVPGPSDPQLRGVVRRDAPLGRRPREVREEEPEADEPRRRHRAERRERRHCRVVVSVLVRRLARRAKVVPARAHARRQLDVGPRPRVRLVVVRRLLGVKQLPVAQRRVVVRLEELWEARPLPSRPTARAQPRDAEVVDEVPRPRRVRHATRHERVPARRADGEVRERRVEHDGLCRERVQVRCHHPLVAVRPPELGPQVVRDQQEHVLLRRTHPHPRAHHHRLHLLPPLPGPGLGGF
mmetsp:Transcript_5640/g.17021  ORF Transcript_5640/g.17021 Transcript_5640/m.17021 type:complete len:299 (+) Transcript_5640:1098-1994(+)